MLVNYDYSKFTPWPFSKTVMTNFYEESQTWQLFDGSLTMFAIELGRRPQFVIVNIILPIILLSFLGVFDFLIPVESGERISYCLTVLLAIAVFLTLVSETLPRVSEPMSYFSYYLLSVLIINVCATIATIINLRFYFAQEDDKPGRFWTCFSRGILCRCNKKNTNTKAEQTCKYVPGTSQTASTCNSVLQYNTFILYPNDIGKHIVTNNDNSISVGNDPVKHDVQSINKHVTWKEVSCSIDRFLFVLFFLCLITDTVIFITTIS